MSKIIKRDMDPANPPALSAAQQARLSLLAKRPDREIDYSDIPPLTDEFWKSAVRNPFYKPTKQSTTVRVDSDVLLWLKGQGKGYQTKINAILRDAMLRSLENKAQ
ncbi:MAG: BrnA antitoxin family protein [Hylemonella sp.]|jgi:uncharacterized protein (DUF4415 family)|nr:BrnA antitoxin family protein [Hylemonella sp.]